MSKMSKAIAALGVVAGLGVAALPLSTYAAIEDAQYKTATSAQVEVKVDGAISIASNLNTGETGTGIGKNGIITLGDEKGIMPGTDTGDMTNPLEVVVSSNTATTDGFNLYINTLEADGALTGESTGAKINGGDASKGSESWGYAYSADGTTFSAYEAVPAGTSSAKAVNGATALNTSTTDKNANSALSFNKAAASTSYFKFKASTKATTAADTYRGTVVFTAVIE